MEIVIRQYDSTVTVRVDSDDLTLDETFELLVRPALLGIGYHPDNVDEYIDCGIEE